MVMADYWNTTEITGNCQIKSLLFQVGFLSLSFLTYNNELNEIAFMDSTNVKWLVVRGDQDREQWEWTWRGDLNHASISAVLVNEIRLHAPWELQITCSKSVSHAMWENLRNHAWLSSKRESFNYERSFCQTIKCLCL